MKQLIGTERDLASYHEAGHAVMAVRTGVPFAQVTMPASGAEPCLDAVIRRSEDPRRADAARLAARQLVAMAGPVAEQIHGAAGPGLETRVRSHLWAAELAAGQAGRACDASYIQELREATTRELGAPEVWAAVEAVAAELVEAHRLPGERVRAIVREAASGPR